MRSLRFPLVAGVILMLLAQTGALAITVIVNGQPLPSYPPALERGGRTLLPMRMVFEALGASVKWEAVTQTAIGTRGDVTVRMSINDRTAYINERPVTLDVPPQLIGGSTYMPVRFPAEAFGAGVSWEGALQQVTITLPPLDWTTPAPLPPVQPPPVTPPPPPVTPPPPPVTPAPTLPPEPVKQPGTVTGVVSAARGNRLAVEVDETLQVYIITADTILLRQNRQASVDDLRVGDLVEVRHDGAGNAVVARATYDTVEGTVLAKVPNQLLIDARTQPLQVRPEVEVTTSAGQQARYADINPGDQVSLRMTPSSTSVYGIVIQRATQPSPTPLTPTQPMKPAIAQFYHEADKPLRAGELLRVTLEGTPGGKAWFDIGDVVKGIELAEARRRQGRYDVEYRVPEGLNALGVPLIGYLEVAGRAADAAQSADPVTIDTVAPQVTVFGPGQDERVTNRQPNLAVLLTDENGVGVDYEKSAVQCRANDKEHLLQVTRRGQVLSAVPAALPDGDIRILVQAYDRAGNRTEDMRRFRVGALAPGAETLSASHDGAAVLMPGDVLTVTATGPTGGQATFDVGTWQRNLPMTEDPKQRGTYRGTLKVPELWWDREEPVVARLRTTGGRALIAQATTSVRLGPRRELAPSIVSPTAGAAVGQEVVVEGHTQPLSEVSITIKWRGRTLVVEQTGQVTALQVTADQTGHFKTDPISLRVQSLFPVRNVRYTLTCVVKSQRGEESDPVTVEFTQ